MHNDSVWSLFSEEPDLEVFYSSDRSGLVVKTDVRGTGGDLDYGISLAVAQENDGVSKVVTCGDYIWTATARSSINRWANFDTADLELPEALREHRASISSAKSRDSSSPVASPVVAAVNGSAKKAIPMKSVLRISNTAPFPGVLAPDADTAGAGGVGRQAPEVIPDPVVHVAEPVHNLPEETIEGQFGLVKHRLLNDRRRVLTLDTAGDVLLWDLIKVTMSCLTLVSGEANFPSANRSRALERSISRMWSHTLTNWRPSLRGARLTQAPATSPLSWNLSIASTRRHTLTSWYWTSLLSSGKIRGVSINPPSRRVPSRPIALSC